MGEPPGAFGALAGTKKDLAPIGASMICEVLEMQTIHDSRAAVAASELQRGRGLCHCRTFKYQLL